MRRRMLESTDAASRYGLNGASVGVRRQEQENAFDLKRSANLWLKNPSRLLGG